MLTRFVRIQLGIFAGTSMIGLVAMLCVYMQVPTLLGLGRYTVTLELPATGGLYRFANVTYRGLQIGKVTDVKLTRTGAQATLSLQTSPKVPANLHAEVRSISAVGEQYVDLQPRNDQGPFLRDGSVIAMRDTGIPQQVGPVLDQASALLRTIPHDKLAGLLDETYRSFRGAGYDLGSLIDSGSTLAAAGNTNGDRARRLLEDSAPLLDGQSQTADDVRTYSRALANVTGQLTSDDKALRTIFDSGPAAAQQVSRLLEQVKPTLPVLLANLTTVGQIAVTYHPALEQLLVLMPPYIASLQSAGVPKHSPIGYAFGEFSLAVADPPVCTVGFLPPSSWRSPSDTTVIDTPKDLYCKLPQDSPIAVRGARNYPCLKHPGKRAATVQMCDSDKSFEPLSMRQHILGPYPIDPNLIGQGIPPDDRVDFTDNIFGPPGGTAPPAQAPLGQAPAVPEPAQQSTAPPEAAPPSGDQNAPPAPNLPALPGSTPSVAPSSFVGSSGPSVALTRYDPQTGAYLTPGGQQFRKTDLVAPAKTWKELVLPT